MMQEALEKLVTYAFFAAGIGIWIYILAFAPTDPCPLCGIPAWQ